MLPSVPQQSVSTGVGRPRSTPSTALPISVASGSASIRSAATLGRGQARKTDAGRAVTPLARPHAVRRPRRSGQLWCSAS